MSELRSSDQISDGIDMWHGRGKVFVYHDTAPCKLQSHVFAKQAVRVDAPSHCTEYISTFRLLLFFFLSVMTEISILVLLNGLHRCRSVDLDSPLFQNHLEILGNFFIHIRDQSRHGFQNRYFRPKGRIYGCEFHTDDTSPDHDKAFRHFFHPKQIIACDDPRQINARNRNPEWPGAGRQ